ncbi:MAG: alkaline phosphatase [Verrucomicrobiaceae bacterium]|nr:alkaline phosphatase [Verrucomicrobiaceae bacterium]
MKNVKHVLLLLLMLSTSFADKYKDVKYVFLFIGDGMSLPQRMIADEYAKQNGLPALAMNKMQYSAITTTRSANKFITDSAAAGTAIACGAKTNNGALGVDANGNNLKSSAQVAKENGKKVGIITSVTLNHATPAAFYAHQTSRGNYYQIGLDLVASDFDFFGGGAIAKYKDKKSKGYKGSVHDIARKSGYKVLKKRSDIEAFKKGDGKVIAYANPKDAIPYLIDEPKSMRISHLLEKAIEVLDNDDEGFFIMVEGGKIDWVCHANDATTSIHETIDFDNAIKVAVEFAKKNPKDTLIVVTGDHETGGLTMGFAGTGYTSNIKLLANQKCSQGVFEAKVKRLLKKNKDASFADVQPLITESFGLLFDESKKDDPMFVNKEEFKTLSDAWHREKLKLSPENKHALFSYEKKRSPISVATVRCFNNKAGLAWTSFAHTALPVMTTASGVNAEAFSGTIDNTDIGKILKEMLDD